MSKERLEGIKEYFGFWMKNDINRDWSLSSETIDNLKYLIEQAERVQELEDKLARIRFVNNDYDKQNKRYREALEEIMKIQENHEWNLYGIAYGIAERTLFEVEGEE